MCRLFGLMANKEVEIRFSMFEAINSFEKQSENNSDGWGIGWYEDGIPKVVKYGECARDSERFKGTVEEVWAKIVIAHVRKATGGVSQMKIPILLFTETGFLLTTAL